MEGCMRGASHPHAAGSRPSRQVSCVAQAHPAARGPLGLLLLGLSLAAPQSPRGALSTLTTGCRPAPPRPLFAR